MRYMFLPLRRYFDFAGRSRRKEYWLFTLGVVIVGTLLLAGMIAAAMSPERTHETVWLLWMFLLGLFNIFIIIPSLAVTVRRFHDQGRTGWLVLLGLIPVLGGLVVVFFMCLEGTRGPNRFGPDPKACASG